jgi:hypothetical protein
MISRKRMRLTALAAVAVIAGGVFALVAPASTKVERVFDAGPAIESSVTIRLWGEDLADDAVDAAGIERNLDGNASALVPADRILRELYAL